MSSRRDVSRRKRAKPADEELEPVEEIPTLEPLEDDELETLEPLEETGSPVGVTTVPSLEEGFEQEVVIDVPDMPKAEVVDAVEGPLRRAVAESGAELRWQRVLVRFGGEALIGSAAKKLVAECLAPAKPLKVVVRRGFGDETVHEGTRPTVKMSATPEPDGPGVTVRVETGEVDSIDLAGALDAPLQQLAGKVDGKPVTFAFTGDARPDATARAVLGEAMDRAGAKRVAILAGDGEDVVFDRELEAHVRIERKGTETGIVVTPTDDEALVGRALALVLRRDPEGISDKRVQVRFEGRDPNPRELKQVVEACARLAPERIELWRGGEDEPDIVWPRLIQASERGDTALLQVRSGGRRRAGVITSFCREVVGLGELIAKKKITVDWPADFALDADAERACIDEALAALGPARIACTFGGEEREPFFPPPLTVQLADAAGGPSCDVRLDTDAGKPVELARAIDRRLRQHEGELRGHRVHVVVKGTGAVSRTMLRTLREWVERAGATRLEIDDRGTVDVLLPPMLTIESDGARAFRIGSDPAGRDDAQVETALHRELDAFELPEAASYRVAASPVAETIAEELVKSHSAARVVLDGDPPVEVHPPLFEPPERSPGSLVLRAAPGSEESMMTAQVARELPPILEASGDLSGVEVLVVWPGASDPHMEPLARTLETVLAAGPKRLSLDAGDGAPTQLFPEIVPDYVTVLGRKDDATPPLVMLGVDRGEGRDHVAKVMAKLEEHAADVEGRRVLITLRTDDRDVAARDDDELVAACRAFVDAKAAATLLFRGRDRARRSYFEVVHSTVDGLAVGTKVRDPRG